jgi:hypothetical protein
MERSLSRSRHPSLARGVFFGAAIFLLAGCGSIAMRHSFNDYSDIYAETQNRQMLQNLARLHEREPIYFFQLAQISAGYTFTETAGLGDLKTVGLPASAVTNLHTASGTIGGTATHNPVFTLVPLGGDKFAQELLAPIKPDIFYELFEEGWPADLLMRVLIERIELVGDVDAAASDNGNTEATEVRANKLEILVNNPWEFKTGHYDRFLRTCGLARLLQQKGALYLDISDHFTPLANVGFKQPPNDQQQLAANKDGLVWQQVSSKDEDSQFPVAEPAKGGLDSSGNRPPPAESSVALSSADSVWQLGKSVPQTLFKLNKGAVKAFLAEQEANIHPYDSGKDNLMMRFQLLLAESGGIGVTDASAVKNSNVKVRLVMRSLIGAMAALANEQEGFAYFQDQMKDRTIAADMDEIPAAERRPALVLEWGKNRTDGVGLPDPNSVIASLVYPLDHREHHQYAIGDAPTFCGNPTNTWNRDVFRLLSQLSLQVTADPSAFALPSLLQSH